MTAEFNKLLAQTGLTKLKLAEIAGVNKSTITNWSKGITQPPKLVIEKLRRISAVVNE